MNQKKEQPRNGEPHMQVERQAVRPRHANDCKKQSEGGGERQKHNRACSEKAREKVSVSREKYDEENGNYNSERGVNQAVRDIKKIGIAKSSQISAVDDEKKREDKERLTDTGLSLTSQLQLNSPKGRLSLLEPALKFTEKSDDTRELRVIFILPRPLPFVMNAFLSLHLPVGAASIFPMTIARDPPLE